VRSAASTRTSGRDEITGRPAPVGRGSKHREVGAMIVLGPLLLLTAGGLAVFGITTRDRVHPPARFGQPGRHLAGPGSRLFFFGLVLAAAALSGLAGMVTRVRRLPASRPPPRASP
jgi:hypothetical protein